MNFGVTFGPSSASVSAAIVVASAPVRFKAACQFYTDCISPAKNAKWACSDKYTDEQRKGMCLNYCRLCKATSGGKH